MLRCTCKRCSFVDIKLWILFTKIFHVRMTWNTTSTKVNLHLDAISWLISKLLGSFFLKNSTHQVQANKRKKKEACFFFLPRLGYIVIYYDVVYVVQSLIKGKKLTDTNDLWIQILWEKEVYEKKDKNINLPSCLQRPFDRLQSILNSFCQLLLDVAPSILHISVNWTIPHECLKYAVL